MRPSAQTPKVSQPGKSPNMLLQARCKDRRSNLGPRAVPAGRFAGEVA